jgi:hypothetical protein
MWTFPASSGHEIIETTLMEPLTATSWSGQEFEAISGLSSLQADAALLGLRCLLSWLLGIHFLVMLMV